MSKTTIENYPIKRYQHIDWDSERWVGFDSRPGDIYVCTCYKSGTTWTQMIAALLVFQNTIFPAPLNELSPWIDLVTDTREVMHKYLAAQNHRRILKTHTPLDGLNWKDDAIYLYVARDPRDVFESMMSHQANTDVETERALAAEMGNASTVTDLLAKNDEERLKIWLTEGFFDWERDGYPYWSALHHGQTFWRHREQENILFLHYSQLKANLSGEMRKISNFLNIEIDEVIFPDLVKAATFSSMKEKADDLVPGADAKLWKNNSQFFARGKNGQWEDSWSVENISRFEDLCNSYPEDYIQWLLSGGEIKKNIDTNSS
ncbi:MAG: sulfotransferase [Rhodobacteraceae bacterium]|nr:sulfotransferase [Paracoccaceae bacterium]